MPTYTYQCANERCKHRFEEMQKITAAPLINCPACKQDTLVRVVSGTSFQLKGENWFKTSGKY